MASRGPHGLVAFTALAYYISKLNAVPAFWIAYTSTRPLGASTGDLLSQVRKAGGLGFGTMFTSAIFLVVIVVLVTYLTKNLKPEDLAPRTSCASNLTQRKENVVLPKDAKRPSSWEIYRKSAEGRAATRGSADGLQPAQIPSRVREAPVIVARSSWATLRTRFLGSLNSTSRSLRHFVQKKCACSGPTGSYTAASPCATISEIRPASRKRRNPRYTVE